MKKFLLAALSIFLITSVSNAYQYPVLTCNTGTPYNSEAMFNRLRKGQSIPAENISAGFWYAYRKTRTCNAQGVCSPWAEETKINLYAHCYTNHGSYYEWITDFSTYGNFEGFINSDTQFDLLATVGFIGRSNFLVDHWDSAAPTPPYSEGQFNLEMLQDCHIEPDLTFVRMTSDCMDGNLLQRINLPNGQILENAVRYVGKFTIGNP